MNTTDEQSRLLAAAIYEIRTLLGGALGSHNEADTPVRLAAHLAYALHNDALAVLEGGREFDCDASRAKIAAAEATVGASFGDGHGELKRKTEA